MKKIITFIIILIFTYLACKKNTRKNLPYVSIRQTIWLNNPENINLQRIGGIKIISGGLNGIIIYRLSKDIFLVYENTCPHSDYKSKCAKLITDSSSIITCPCDNSKFSLVDGSSLSKITDIPLKKYNVVYNNQNQTLTIIN